MQAMNGLPTCLFRQFQILLFFDNQLDSGNRINEADSSLVFFHAGLSCIVHHAELVILGWHLHTVAMNRVNEDLPADVICYSACIYVISVIFITVIADDCR